MIFNSFHYHAEFIKFLLILVSSIMLWSLRRLWLQLLLIEWPSIRFFTTSFILYFLLSFIPSSLTFSYLSFYLPFQLILLALFITSFSFIIQILKYMARNLCRRYLAKQLGLWHLFKFDNFQEWQLKFCPQQGLNHSTYEQTVVFRLEI